MGEGSCSICPRRCRIVRGSGRTGFCGVDSGIPVAHAELHFGEEPPISGTRGSGTIFIVGCNLRCVFCQNYQISQERGAVSIETHEPRGLAKEMIRLQGLGAHNVNLVSPSHVVPELAEAILVAKDMGLTVPVVYNSGGYDSIGSLRRIRGLVDIFLPDLKYVDNDLGKRYSGVDDYADVAVDAIREMFEQVGNLIEDEDGIACHGLLVRHLVLPGHIANTEAALRFLAGFSKELRISLMSQYSPRHRASRFPEIDRPLDNEEYEKAVEIALDLGLDSTFVQEMESRDLCLPRFDDERPFDFCENRMEKPERR